MFVTLKSTWEEVVRPLILRPEWVQVAALCMRGSGDDQEVLLITSRGTGRWIVPKGWPIEGKTGPETAAQEAWEEAGVKPARVIDDPVGSYTYRKIRKDGATQSVRANVYRVDVDELAEDFPEAGQRERRWMTPQEAADLVAEPKLQAILRAL